MERATPQFDDQYEKYVDDLCRKFESIDCSDHPKYKVMMLKRNASGFPSLICGKCLMSISDQEKASLFEFNDYLREKIAHFLRTSDSKPPICKLPDEVKKTMESTSSKLEELKKHIENEIKFLIPFIDGVKARVYPMIDRILGSKIQGMLSQYEAYKMVCCSLHSQVDALTPKEKGKDMLPVDKYKESIGEAKTSGELEKTMERTEQELLDRQKYAKLSEEEVSKLALQSVMDFTQMVNTTIKPKWDWENQNTRDLYQKFDKKLEECLTEIAESIRIEKPLIYCETFFLDTCILQNSEEALYLIGVLKAPGVSLELLYRATRDGFEARSFHNRCDKKGPTLVLIRSQNGKVFGGVAMISWDATKNAHAACSEGFLFTLNPNQKVEIKNNLYAIYSHSSYGPCFGSGDLYVSNDGHKNNSTSTLANAYNVLPGNVNTLAGVNSFLVKEIEVFQLIYR